MFFHFDFVEPALSRVGSSELLAKIAFGSEFIVGVVRQPVLPDDALAVLFRELAFSAWRPASKAVFHFYDPDPVFYVFCFHRFSEG